MAQNTGTQVVAPIVTPDSNDKFPTHINSMGQGGYKAVQSIAERDAIPDERRENGMLCAVLQNDTVYQLKGGTDNAFWTIFTTGAGGATTATDLPFTAPDGMVSSDVQSAIEEIEAKKVNIKDIYTKAETDDKLANHAHAYEDITNLPDLSSLHTHTNIETLKKFSEIAGQLAFAGKSLGNMIADMYDSDNDGIIDKAATLAGLTTTVQMLNYTTGLTGNIQAQLNAISSGTVFKGEYATWADVEGTIQDPKQGYWVFVAADELHSGARTQYYHDGNTWIFGGGASNIPDATGDTKGGILLGGVLDNPAGTSDAPLLKDTGVDPGLYKGANIIVGEDGRVTYAENGNSAYINDSIVSDSETWSSQKISDDLSLKSNKDHTHEQLHAPDSLGGLKIDMDSVSNKRVLTYDAILGKLVWSEASGGRVYVGSRSISGDFRLVAGAYTSLSIDEKERTVTINSTAGGGMGTVPTYSEITHTEVVAGGQSVFIDLDASFSKYDIRTIEVSNTVNSIVDVEVYDSSAEPRRRIYRSNKEMYIYDMVNVPCHDKDETQKIHLKLTNYGSIETSMSLVIVTTNLV